MQRLPVRIRFAEAENYQDRIRPGMSATVQIDDMTFVRRSDRVWVNRERRTADDQTKIALAAFGLLVPVAIGHALGADDSPSPRQAPSAAESDTLPPALPAERPRGQETGLTIPQFPFAAPGRPIRLAGSLALSLRNVETVQANLSVRTATVARFEALKAFVPLVDMPQLQVGLNRVTGPVGGTQTVIFPDVTGGTPFVNQAGLVNAELNRFNISCRWIRLDTSPLCRLPRKGFAPRS